MSNGLYRGLLVVRYTPLSKSRIHSGWVLKRYFDKKRPNAIYTLGLEVLFDKMIYGAEYGKVAVEIMDGDNGKTINIY